jgi:hypothetical protein
MYLARRFWVSCETTAGQEALSSSPLVQQWPSLSSGILGNREISSREDSETTCCLRLYFTPRRLFRPRAALVVSLTTVRVTSPAFRCSGTAFRLEGAPVGWPSPSGWDRIAPTSRPQRAHAKLINRKIPPSNVRACMTRRITTPFGNCL